jgi:hypothetical protein
MIFPIIVLALNLVWPRSPRVKLVGVITLVLAAWLPDLNTLDRVVGLTERILTHEQEGTPEQIVSNLHVVRDWSHQMLLYVCLGFTLAVTFALIPSDIVSRLCQRDAPKKPLQAIPIGIGTAPLGSEADERHNAVVAGAGAPPAAVPEPGR